MTVNMSMDVLAFALLRRSWQPLSTFLSPWHVFRESGCETVSTLHYRFMVDQLISDVKLNMKRMTFSMTELLFSENLGELYHASRYSFQLKVSLKTVHRKPTPNAKLSP